MATKVDTPHRQLYFGEKSILIEKNWKAWTGDPALLEKNLIEWEKQQRKIEEENAQLKQEISNLKQEISNLKQEISNEQTGRIADKNQYGTELSGKQSIIQQWETLYQSNTKFTKQVLLFLGDALYITRPGSYEIFQMSHLQDLLVKEKNKNGSHKTYWTIKELVGARDALTKEQNTIYNILGATDIKGTNDIRKFLTYNGSQKTLKSLFDDRNRLQVFFDSSAVKTNKRTTSAVLGEIDLYLTLKEKFDSQNVSINQVGNIVKQLDNIFKDEKIKISKISKGGLSRKNVKASILEKFVAIDKVIGYGLGENWSTDEE